MISQVLHRGVKHSNSCISYFLSFYSLHFSSLLPLPLFIHRFPQDLLLLSLKVPVLSLNPPFLSSWAILESWLTKGKLLLLTLLSI